MVCLGLKPEASDGRCRRIHLAMAAPCSCTVYVTLKIVIPTYVRTIFEDGAGIRPSIVLLFCSLEFNYVQS